MKLITSMDEIKEPFLNAVVTIGNFDGVHLGHREIFNAVIQKAGAINGTSVAITFEPHPMKVLKKTSPPPLITLFEQKSELIKSTGIDVLVRIPFSKSFAAVTAHEFVCGILLAKIGMKAIVVGKDYTFGKNRKGNIDFLKSYGNKYGFEIIVTDWIFNGKRPEDRVSSTRIRKSVQDGDVTEAEKMLGRPYQLRGAVTPGRNRGGRILGCPTANIKLTDELCPKTGVYAVTVEVNAASEGKIYDGVANIGYSPTFEDHLFTVEVHILGFSGDLYDRPIRVNFHERIRSEKRFSSIEELSAQIKQDIRIAERILAT
ncbi:MAG: bifunctional riboflavin kinase/FAD synthetase [Deltaproteobacteria bacterium]|nr:bifunctional riboflavin kinase/FAD synthetase [Deltaproteobacteria bacterium]